MSHTPAPWTINGPSKPDNTGGRDYGILDSDGKIIAETFQHVGRYASGGFDTRPAEANAKLIAAAPDLLAAAWDALQSLRRLKHPDEDNGHEIIAGTESGYAYRVTCVAQLEQAIAKAEGVK